LNKAITTRQIIFMALGGSIGAGLMFASGNGLREGGPGTLITGFSIVGFGVWCTMCALGELSATFPVQGSFYDYSVRFISPSWGFAMGWNYVMNFILIVPFEITVMVLVAKYWKTDINSLWLVPVIITGLFGIAALGAKWYAEAEHAFGILKVAILATFTITAVVICAGGVPNDPRDAIGFEYWADGGAFTNGPRGFLLVFLAAGLAYGGTEMLGLTVAECKHPQKVMPLAAKIVGGRILLCYLLPLFMVGLIVKPSVFLEEPFKGMSTVSPFVVAVRKANIIILPDVINAVIFIAVFSMANASIYASSRALHAICAQGMGPRLFGKTTEKTRLPAWALGAVAVVCMLAFINAAPKGDDIFDWLLALGSASNYFTWMSICFAHLRMRWAMKRQGKTDVLKWKSPIGAWGSIISIIISFVGLVAQLVSAILPRED
ncbi:amino acid permease/ SLC12A domain-containing protein, partial [Pseudomassariella vexata]